MGLALDELMTDRIYIPHLREGSDDCWDGFTWAGPDAPISQALYPQAPGVRPRPCVVWTGTSDRDVLAHFGTTDSKSPTDD